MLALFAQAAQPMFAHERVETASRLRRLRVGNVSFRASRTIRAMAGLEGFAYWSIGGEADLVGLSEEG